MRTARARFSHQTICSYAPFAQGSIAINTIVLTRSTGTVQTSAKAHLISAAIWRISMNECPLTTLRISQ